MNSELVPIDNKSLPVKSNEKYPTFCSIQPKTRAEKIKLFNALERADALINDMEGQVIEVKHIYIQPYDSISKDTGEPRVAYKTVLFDVNMNAYITTSTYFAMTVEKLLTIWGDPATWEEPMKLKIVKRQVEKGKTLTFEIVD